MDHGMHDLRHRKGHRVSRGRQCAAQDNPFGSGGSNTLNEYRGPHSHQAMILIPHQRYCIIDAKRNAPPTATINRSPATTRFAGEGTRRVWVIRRRVHSKTLHEGPRSKTMKKRETHRSNACSRASSSNPYTPLGSSDKVRAPIVEDRKNRDTNKDGKGGLPYSPPDNACNDTRDIGNSALRTYSQKVENTSTKWVVGHLKTLT